MPPNVWCAERSWMNRLQPTFESSNSFIDPMTPDRPQIVLAMRRLSTESALRQIVSIDRKCGSSCVHANLADCCNLQPRSKNTLGQPIPYYYACVHGTSCGYAQTPSVRCAGRVGRRWIRSAGNTAATWHHAGAGLMAPPTAPKISAPAVISPASNARLPKANDKRGCRGPRTKWVGELL